MTPTFFDILYQFIRLKEQNKIYGNVTYLVFHLAFFSIDMVLVFQPEF